MNRKVLFVEFHTPIFMAGNNIGVVLPSPLKTWPGLSMKCTSIGVHVFIASVKTGLNEEGFVPWSNVKNVKLAPEEPSLPPAEAKKVSVKAVA